ncbi:MAG: TonB-dependent receptor, partial [Bacteroidia bacterium]|nr:TonB-dependent receptor [Bacteroidia bacterium]
SSGYATGVDFRINGQFVPGIESWMSLSVLQTRENIAGDSYFRYFNSNGVEIIPGFTVNDVATDSTSVEPGLIPRPTDQRVTFSLFFQDYLPKNPSIKMNLSLIFGTGLPFGPPDSERYRDVFRIPPYRRVDVGFSKQIIDPDQKKDFRVKTFNHIESFWITLEVFNLLQVNNTASYLWIKDVNNRQYAVPNFLTARQLNVKLNLEF